MAYIHKELNFEHKKQLINLLYKGFNRSKSFWESSIEMLISYQMSIDDKKIGFGLFLNDKLVGAMIIINDRSNNTASLSSLYVMQAHRAETLSFLKKAIDSIDQNQINDFSQFLCGNVGALMQTNEDDCKKDFHNLVEVFGER